MNLDKKSLIQIVVLVVLIVVGAGAYLMQQGEGLNLDFITGFFESKPAVTRAPTTNTKTSAERKSASTPAMGATTGASPAMPAANDVPVIPPTPAKGLIHGKPFVVESSSIENGVLTLRLGKDVTADLEVKIMLPTPPWEVPSGKHYRITPTAGADAPQIVLAWKDDGQNAPAEQKFNDKYTLLLELGQEKDKKLPGKIYLSLPDEVKSHVAGTFDADVKGFRIVDGKPDLAADSVDTLQYLALRELLKDDPNKSLEVVGFRDGRYSPSGAADKKMTGYIEAEYRFGQGPSTIERFQFEKNAGDWKVARTLHANQLAEAHPLRTPGPKDSPADVLTYLAAKRLEADTHKKNPKKDIYDSAFTTRHSDKFKIAVCEVSYKLDPAGDTVKNTYLFKRRAGGWMLDRELGKKEKVNFDTGRILKR